MPEGLTAWVLDSEGALRAGRAICAAVALGGICAVGIVLANLSRGREVPGVTLLLVPGIPVLVAGQLWGIATVGGRRDRAEGGRPKWFRINTGGDPRRLFFEGLPVRQASALLVVAFLAWLAAITAWPSLIAGNPTTGTPSCRYRLLDHGDYSCVSRSTYLAAGAAEQRFVAGILCGFFVVQFGMAAAELRRRRLAESPAVA